MIFTNAAPTEEHHTMSTQHEIPGMEHPHGDKQLDELLAARRKTSKMRKKWQDREAEEGAAIERRMQEKKFEVYVSRTHNPPLIAKLTPTSKLKIDEYEDATTPEEDDDDERGSVKYAEMSEQKATKKKPVIEEV